jgi:hypothetical protein
VHDFLRAVLRETEDEVRVAHVLDELTEDETSVQLGGAIEVEHRELTFGDFHGHNSPVISVFR